MKKQMKVCSLRKQQLGFFLNPFRFAATVVPTPVPPVVVPETTLVYSALAATATPTLVFTETK